MSEARPRTLLIACGALAREALAVLEANRLEHVELTCVSALLHNRPQKIPAAVREKIREVKQGYDRILVLYGDCGTGGELDRVLAEEGVERIDGPHCYAFYAGQDVFDALAEAEPGTFYLTDFLARQFETLVIEGLGLDRHPELTAKAEAAAARLGLRFERRFTGLGGLAEFVRKAA